MRIRVQYHGEVRAVLGDKREEEVDVPPQSTVRDLLKGLSEGYEDSFRREVFEDDGGEVREGLLVTVNGRAVGQLDGPETLLEVGDVVALFPLFAGGG